EAFGNQRWRKSSQRLRNGRSPAERLAFVATDGKRVIGTARLCTVECGTGLSALLLGPVAVRPLNLKDDVCPSYRGPVPCARPAGVALPRSCWLVTYRTTAASASPRRRPRPCACPVRSNATGCWPSNSYLARSMAPAVCCAHPASGCHRWVSLPPPHN